MLLWREIKRGTIDAWEVDELWEEDGKEGGECGEGKARPTRAAEGLREIDATSRACARIPPRTPVELRMFVVRVFTEGPDVDVCRGRGMDATRADQRREEASPEGGGRRRG